VQQADAQTNQRPARSFSCISTADLRPDFAPGLASCAAFVKSSADLPLRTDFRGEGSGSMPASGSS